MKKFIFLIFLVGCHVKMSIISVDTLIKVKVKESTPSCLILDKNDTVVFQKEFSIVEDEKGKRYIYPQALKVGEEVDLKIILLESDEICEKE